MIGQIVSGSQLIHHRGYKMRGKPFLFVVLAITAIWLSACDGTGSPGDISVEITIDIPCTLQPGTQKPLSLRGVVPSGARIKWQATHGTVSPDDQVNTLYTAPDVETEDSIGVEIVTADSSIFRSLNCSILLIETPDVVIDVTSDVSLPTSQSQVTTDSNQPIPTIASSVEVAKTVSITEVMADPCGEAEELEKANEFIEIYNYGDAPANIQGWWIADNGSASNGHPDLIVAWETRFPNAQVGFDLITDDTTLQPGQYAVILSPFYTLNTRDPMPYYLPPGTMVLTVAEGERLGDDSNGLLGNEVSVLNRDVIILYRGTFNYVEEVVSTYGSPSPIRVGTSVLQIADNGEDSLPLQTTDCLSAQRKLAAGPDVESNWALKEPSVGLPFLP